MFTNERQKILKDFSRQSDNLFSLEIIRTDNFTGEIGEYVACCHFDLTKTERVTKAVDAIDKKGKKYQIKAKVIYEDKINYGIGNLDIESIDYLVIAYFSEYYKPLRIIRIPKSQLPQVKVGISNKFLSSIKYETLNESEIILPAKMKKEIRKFGELYVSLVENNIIGSRRIVGDLGEFYACQHLNLKLNDNKNEKGVDAIDSKERKYEIKTRRVYESGRRTGKSRRLNNLVGKESEFLVVVVLDRNFNCAGMWIMPMKNIHNPKSAHLQIVNTTPGVKNIVKSKIDWLH